MESRTWTLAVMLSISVTLCAHSARAQITAVTDFAPNPAAIEMFVHVPPTVPSGPRPLVVALHGCVQTAGEYARTGWNGLADEYGFYVVYPQQSTRRNSGRCFNWGGGWEGMPNSFVASSTALRLGDIRRGGPELVSIIAMLDHMVGRYDIDASRVFVTGLSGGGGMASVLLAAYPDRFAGGSIVAGIPYGCATDQANVGEANACTRAPTGTGAYLDRDPAGWAALVREAYPGYAGPWPRVSVWHYASDFTVAPAWSDQIVEQWTALHGADQSADASDTLDGAMRATFNDGTGRPIVERWTVPGVAHGTPVDPARGCGMAGSYILDAGICSSRWAAEFLGLTSDAPVAPRPDAGPPSTSDGGHSDAGPMSTPIDAGASGPHDAGMSAAMPGDAGASAPPVEREMPRRSYQLLGCQAGAPSVLVYRAGAWIVVAMAWLAMRRRRRQRADA